MASYACPVDQTTWGHTSYPELTPTAAASPQVVYHQTSPVVYHQPPALFPSAAGGPAASMAAPTSASQPPPAPARKWSFAQQDTAVFILFLAVVGLTVFVFHINSRIATLHHMMQYLIMHGMAKSSV